MRETNKNFQKSIDFLKRLCYNEYIIAKQQ